jgi:DNA-binding transcriptional LysR family regulator
MGITHVCTSVVRNLTGESEQLMWQWDDVRYFLALARARSLSGAARELRVDHATVGRRLAALEDQLGAKLFDRTPEGFAITAAGQTILSECEAMESSAAEVNRMVAGHDSRLSGLVKVATTEVLARLVVVPAVVPLMRRHPELQVEMMTGLHIVDVARREADIALRLNRPDDPALVCRKLGEFAFSVYAAPNYLARRDARGSSSRPEEHSIVSYLGAPSWFREALGASRVTLGASRVALYSNSPFVQLKAVADGVGIGFLACAEADSDPALTRLNPEQPPMRRPVWLVTHQDLRRIAKIRLVLNAIAETFARIKPQLRNGLRAPEGDARYRKRRVQLAR